MTRYEFKRHGLFAVLSLIVLASLSTVGFAQSTKIQGMIKARSGATMIVQVPNTTDSVTVLLTDSTQVGQIQGVLKVRRKDMSMAALIPGLEVQVEGAYNDQRQMIAKTVKFQGNDLERAQAIQAGLHQTKVQTEMNKDELAKQDAELKAQQERIASNADRIANNADRIAAAEETAAAHKALIEAAVARFGQLDDYYILDEVVILFANGKSIVDPQYKPQLLQLAQKAKTVDAYMIQVIGYASSVGSAALNQKLSEDRAANVTNFITQQGYIPLTNLLAPGAMGASRQVGDDKSAEGQAQNRRVVVRVLQNKGIAGLKDLK